MKKSLLLISVLFLIGCEKYTTEISGDYVLPEGLADCKIYRLQNDGGGQIKVVRCPNSDTSAEYKEGKFTRHTIVIDGKTYVEEEK